MNMTPRLAQRKARRHDVLPVPKRAVPDDAATGCPIAPGRLIKKCRDGCLRYRPFGVDRYAVDARVCPAVLRQRVGREVIFQQGVGGVHLN